jgi:ERCC4-related helicase
MRIISFTEARNGLKAVLDGVVNDADTTIITRRDAEDAVVFNKLVAQYKANPSTEIKNEIKPYLKKWSKNHEKFLSLEMSPILSELEPLSKNLSQISNSVLQVLDDKNISDSKVKQMQQNLLILKQEHVDVDVVIVDALEILSGISK